MGFFHKYPYTDLNELNLDWVINMIKSLINQVENFVSLNAIKYADPIQWSIVTQYQKNTVVIDPLTGIAYISVTDVPQGVLLTDTNYWTVVFDLSSFVIKTARNFTNRYEAETTTTATFNSAADDWLIWGDVLYHVDIPITIGTVYTIGTNLTKFTLEDYIGHLADLLTSDKTSVVNAVNEIVTNIGSLANLTTIDKTSIVNAINELDTKTPFVTPEMFGAVGDGVTDDSDAIDAALAYDNIILTKTYLVSRSFNLHNNTTITGSGTIKIAGHMALTNAIFSIIGINNIRISGIIFDSNVADQDGYLLNDPNYNTPIYIESADKINISNCYFNGIYTIGINLYSISGEVNISDNIFDCGAASSGHHCLAIRLENITNDSHFNITNNNFKSTVTDFDYGYGGVFIANSYGHVNINDNTFYKMGRSQVGMMPVAPIDLYANVANANINGNCIYDSFHCIRIINSHDVIFSNNFYDEVSAKNPQQAPIAAFVSTYYGLPLDITNIIISDNTIITHSTAVSAIQLSSQDADIAPHHITISGNTINADSCAFRFSCK